MVGIIPPHGHFDSHAVFFAINVNRFGNKRLFGLIDIFDKFDKSTFIMQCFFTHISVSAICQTDTNTRIQKSELAKAPFQRIEIEFDHCKCFGTGKKSNFRTGFIATFANNFQRSIRFAMGESHFMNFTLAFDAQFQPDRQRVDDRNANPVKTAGNFIGILVEFTASVKLRHNDFSSRNTLCRVNFCRNPAPVISHCTRAIPIQCDCDKGCIAGQCLVNRIVNNFIDHMVQT